MVASPRVLDKQGLGQGAPSPRKGTPQRATFSFPGANPVGDGPGFPSSLAGGSCSGHKANENHGGAGSPWHAQPKQGWLAWWVPAWPVTAAPQQCDSSATAAWSSPSCWRIPSPSAKGRAKTKNSGKKEISSVSSCWFPAFLCFCGIVCNLLLWGSWGSLSPWCRLQS